MQLNSKLGQRVAEQSLFKPLSSPQAVDKKGTAVCLSLPRGCIAPCVGIVTKGSTWIFVGAEPQPLCVAPMRGGGNGHVFTINNSTHPPHETSMRGQPDPSLSMGLLRQHGVPSSVIAIAWCVRRRSHLQGRGHGRQAHLRRQNCANLGTRNILLSR